MRIISEINTVKVKFWECIGEVDADVEKMFDFCEGFRKEKMYDIDDVIGDLETIGKTKAKRWLICNDNSTEEKDFELKIDFENGFFICFGKGWIEGKVYD